MAGPTRLELATSGVTGRRSNQLNYDPALNKTLHANSPPTATSVNKHLLWLSQAKARNASGERWLVGGTGLEPVTAGV